MGYVTTSIVLVEAAALMGVIISFVCGGVDDDEKRLIAALARRGTAYKDEGNHKQDTFETLIHLGNMEEYMCVPHFVEIGVRCSNLPREDMFSLSDPMVIIYEKSSGSIWREQGRTELIMNNLNPIFLQHIRVMIRPGQDQRLMVKVVDLDGDVDERFVEVDNCTSLAKVECSMEDLLSTAGNKDKCLVLPETLEQTANPLSIALYAEYVSRPRGRVEVKISALNLHIDEKTSTDGKPAILYEILREVLPARHMPEGTPSRFVRVYKSEMSSSNDPDWDSITLEEASLDNGDPCSKFVINVSNFQADGSYKLLGTVKMDSTEAAGHALSGKDILLFGAMSKQASLGRLVRRSIGLGQRSLHRVSAKASLNKLSYYHNDQSMNSPSTLKPETSASSRREMNKADSYKTIMSKAESKLSRMSSHKALFPSIRIDKWEVKPRASMIDFLRSGAEIQFMVGIDMTKENKHPDKRGSLHFLLGQGPSSVTRYEEVLIRIQRLLTGRCISRTNGVFSLQSVATGQASDPSLSNQTTLRRSPGDLRTSMQLRGRGPSASPLEPVLTSRSSTVGHGSMAPLSFAASIQSSKPGGFSVIGFGAHKPGMPPPPTIPFSQRGTCADMSDFSRLYRHALTKWRLSGPRNFAPLIEEACSMADREVDREAAYSAALIAHDYSDPTSNDSNRDWPTLLPPAYTILILLTCGPPDDLKETLDAMTRASSLPMSIVVIDVNDMELPDDFRLKLLDERGRTTEEMRQMFTFLANLNMKKPEIERPNVRFVQYRKHPLMGEISDEELMLDILSSVPAQYLEYCRCRGFDVPNNQDFAFNQHPVALNEVAIDEGVES